MAQEDIRSDKLGEPHDEAAATDATRLKKRARRRLIGAVALALLAAIVLPMVMDHQPAPPLRDIQVRIPSPDEGAARRATSKPITVAPAREDKPVPMPVETPPPAKPEIKEAAPAARPSEAKSAERTETKPIAKIEPRPEPKIEPKPETKPESKSAPSSSGEAARAESALSGKGTDEAWEVQLGAYQEPGRVKLLVGKLKELGIPTYTEKVETPNGPRTRVRAGPFPSQEAAEKARTRVKIVGVDGPVAKKP